MLPIPTSRSSRSTTVLTQKWLIHLLSVFAHVACCAIKLVEAARRREPGGHICLYIRHSKQSYYGPGLQAPKRLNASEQQIELTLQLNLSPPQISSNGSGIRNGDCEGSDSQFRAVESICLFM
jgi:hypothetical protein